jgi:GH35 family endo-1,4-beta-xylanase
MKRKYNRLTKHVTSIILVLFASLTLFSCVKENKALDEINIESDLEKSLNPNNFPLKKVNPNILVGAELEDDLDDDAYIAVAKKEFNTGQALYFGGFGGWNGINDFDFAPVNRVVNWMVENNMSPHVCMLTGQDIYNPEWLINGNWTKQELNNLLKNQIYSIMDANDNKNKVDVWNVINEIFEEDGTYRTNVVWNQMGWESDVSGLNGIEKINNQHPKFVRQAFKYCREKTNAKLEYRDYNIESNNPESGLDKKHKAVYQLLKHMINSNIPIDVVGLQGHYEIGNVDYITENNGLKNIVEKYKSLGIEVYIVEMDFAAPLGATWNTTLAQAQKQDYYNYTKQAIEGGATRIYTWGIDDGRDPYWLTTQYPLPWNENLEKKPAYYGIQKALYDTR